MRSTKVSKFNNCQADGDKSRPLLIELSSCSCGVKCLNPLSSFFIPSSPLDWFAIARHRSFVTLYQWANRFCYLCTGALSSADHSTSTKFDYSLCIIQLVPGMRNNQFWSTRGKGSGYGTDATVMDNSCTIWQQLPQWNKLEVANVWW